MYWLLFMCMKNIYHNIVNTSHSEGQEKSIEMDADFIPSAGASEAYPPEHPLPRFSSSNQGWLYGTVCVS